MTRNKRHKEGYIKPAPRRKGRVRGRPEKSKPRVDDRLERLFRKIGRPEPGVFTPDPFQLEALDLIADNDVLVSAATGSGKTWIASRAIQDYLSKGMRVWYASPLKALSNSVYRLFSDEFGPDRCGILTGDRKENPDARVIVGTTEILRNQLYDAMERGSDLETDLVILDEAHYISDPERGVVWEEVLIYLPARIRLLMLSATISNGDEISAWLEGIRGTPCRVVSSQRRPVPLETIFLFPDGLMIPLGTRKGLDSRIKKYLHSRSGRGGMGKERPDFGKIIGWLRKFDLLPAIFFLKSRADCDRAVHSCPPARRGAGEKEGIEASARAFLQEHPHLMGHAQTRPLLKSRVGSHHGGQLPYWKVFVEHMMNEGFLEAIFSTSTVAAGVNFPARTVVLVQSDRFNGRDFIDLTATELHQMIGRAGRRGKDRIGFALVLPGRHQDPRLIRDLIRSSPEPLSSRIHINFSMTLNLLLSHRPLEVKHLLERSFAAFKEERKASGGRAWEATKDALVDLLPDSRCDATDPYDVHAHIRERRELRKRLRKQNRDAKYNELAALLEPYLEKGRLFLHKNGNIYAVSRLYHDHGRLVCSAYNVKRVRRGRRKKKPRRARVDISQVQALYDFVAPLPDEATRSSLEKAFSAIPFSRLEEMDTDVSAASHGNESRDTAGEEGEALPCDECRHLRLCHGPRNAPFMKVLRDSLTMADALEGTGEGLWISFKRHVRFLKETGFVDDEEYLTPDGSWASRLRLDQPLLIAEAIRRGAFTDIPPELLAGGLAPFVWDRSQDVELRAEGPVDLSGASKMYERVTGHIASLRALKEERGFESPPLMFWPAAALVFWAGGATWEELMEFVPVSEGDMASLIMRTADHLRQVGDLSGSHPELASRAHEAVKLILREPVYFS